MQAVRSSSTPLFVALLANALLLVVFALQIRVGPEPVLPYDHGDLTAFETGWECSADALSKDRRALRDSVEAAEQAHERAITPLEQAASREQLERLHEQVQAHLSRARECDDRMR